MKYQIYQAVYVIPENDISEPFVVRLFLGSMQKRKHQKLGCTLPETGSVKAPCGVLFKPKKFMHVQDCVAHMHECTQRDGTQDCGMAR